ncbi:MAG: hypothetical protein IT424_15990 [Pirellulales bacterium]|nr:hypothetical protein [Pirellulales bacterium]
MSLLVENPLGILVAGAIAAVMALVFFLARRTGGALAALAGVLLATAALTAVERLVVTEREQVASRLAELFAAIEANDLQRTLDCVDPNSGVAADVRALMPLLRVEKVRGMGGLDIDLHLDLSPPAAVSSCRVYLDGIHGRSGARVVYANQRVDISWTRPAEAWVVSGYTAYYEGRPIDAVESARANRPR